MYGNIAAPRHLNWVPGLPLRVVMLAIAVGFAALWCVDMAGRALAARPANETAALARIAETAQLVDELRGQVAAAVAATAGGAGAVHLDKATVTLAAFAQHHARNVAD